MIHPPGLLPTAGLPINSQSSRTDSNQPPSIDTILHRLGKNPVSSDDYEPIEKHPDMKNAAKKMWTWSQSLIENLYHCPLCKERSLETIKATYQDAKNEECTKCYTSRKKNGGIRKMTAENNMDPFPAIKGGFNWDLFRRNISVVEEMITSPILSIFKAYILPSGNYKYQGNVINYEQNVHDFALTLPRRIQGLPVTIIVRKSNDKFPSGYKDFRVRRETVIMIINYIWFLFYKDCPGASIDKEYIANLPEDDSVQDQIVVTT